MLFAVMLSACASNAATSTTNPPTAASASNPTQSAQKQLKVAILFSEKISGSAFDENTYQGLQLIHTKLGAQVADTENVQVPDIQNTLRNYASNGYQLVFGNSFEYGDPEIAIAKDYPNTDFVSITGNVSSTNVSSVDFAQGESGYVLGVLAGASAGCVLTCWLLALVFDLNFGRWAVCLRAWRCLLRWLAARHAL
jgi:basic membrane protein A and related proteins